MSKTFSIVKRSTSISTEQVRGGARGTARGAGGVDVLFLVLSLPTILCLWWYVVVGRGVRE